MDPSWLAPARAEIGLREGAGATDNPRVVAMFGEAGHPEIHHDSTAWCAAFVGAMLHRAGLKGTGSLWALDYAKWGARLAEPALGCVGYRHRTGGGHVFFVVGANADTIFALGGNQSNMVCVEAIPRVVVDGYRWPAGVPVSAAPLPSTIAAAKRGVSEA